MHKKISLWYLTPGQALYPKFRCKHRGINHFLLARFSGTRRRIKIDYLESRIFNTHNSTISEARQF